MLLAAPTLSTIRVVCLILFFPNFLKIQKFLYSQLHVKFAIIQLKKVSEKENNPDHLYNSKQTFFQVDIRFQGNEGDDKFFEVSQESAQKSVPD